MLFPPVALERAMTIREVVLRAMSGAISWVQAAEIIGCTERTCRRTTAPVGGPGAGCYSAGVGLPADDPARERHAVDSGRCRTGHIGAPHDQ
jgi:hypothetical protein